MGDTEYEGELSRELTIFVILLQLKYCAEYSEYILMWVWAPIRQYRALN